MTTPFDLGSLFTKTKTKGVIEWQDTFNLRIRTTALDIMTKSNEIISDLDNAFSSEIVATENISILSVVTSAGLKADTTNPTTRNKIIGVNKIAILNGFSGFIYFGGEITDSILSAFSVGDEIFLNGNTLSVTPPTTGYIQSVGIISKTNTLLISISEAILL